jgi:hypoxanthine-DNA glycosylase
MKAQVAGKEEQHPYKIFIPTTPNIIIVGTFPIGKFTDPEREDEIKKNEINFYYGGERNAFWKILFIIFNVELRTYDQIVSFLEIKGIAVGDVIRLCRRINGSASDNSLCDQTWNYDLKDSIIKNNISTILYTSIAAKNWFHEHLGKVPNVKEVCLLSPSGNGLRQIGRTAEFKKWKAEGTNRTATEYRLNKYKKIFLRELQN